MARQPDLAQGMREDEYLGGISEMRLIPNLARVEIHFWRWTFVSALIGLSVRICTSATQTQYLLGR